jgi:predicted glycosyltransferase
MGAMLDGPVWIDLANSPHVLFFRPVIDALQAAGAAVVVTARDFAQTVPLCELYGVDCTVVGAHGGAGIPAKIRNLFDRVTQLRFFVQPFRPSVAVSHNSYTQIVAARTLGIPSMTAMDYEHQPANHLAFRMADAIALPEALPVRITARQGASRRKTWRYPGIKEDISLAGFTSTPGYLESVGLDPSRVTVVVRPPADMALYHRFENVLFSSVLERLRAEAAQVVLLARTVEQAFALEGKGFGEMLWRGPVLDGRELVAACDLVVSAGGTMNREAAALGVPAFSVYAGEPAAVDAWLEDSGRLVFVRNPDDVRAIRVAQRADAGVHPRNGTGLLDEFVSRVLRLARTR